MDDEEFETLPLEQRRKVLDLLRQDPTKDITEHQFDDNYKPTPEQLRSMRLLERGRVYLLSKGHDIEPYPWSNDHS